MDSKLNPEFIAYLEMFCITSDEYVTASISTKANLLSAFEMWRSREFVLSASSSKVDYNLDLSIILTKVVCRAFGRTELEAQLDISIDAKVAHLFEPIRQAYESLYVALIWNESLKSFTFHILYDDMLDRPIICGSNAISDLQVTESAPGMHKNNVMLTWKDIDGAEFIMPPDRRSLYECVLWTGKFAVDKAKESTRPHLHADCLGLDDTKWGKMFACLSPTKLSFLPPRV